MKPESDPKRVLKGHGDGAHTGSVGAKGLTFDARRRKTPRGAVALYRW
jgi:hypothetical protein